MTEPDDASRKSSSTELLAGDPALGSIIRSARKAAGLSQTDLGKRLGGVSKAAVSQWEKGIHKITDEHRRQLSVALNIPLDVMFRVENEVRAPQREVTDSEWDMVRKFRQLRHDRQEALLLVLSSYGDQSEPPG